MSAPEFPLRLLGSHQKGENMCAWNNLRYADDTTVMAESEEELKSLLMKGKRREKKLA